MSSAALPVSPRSVPRSTLPVVRRERKARKPWAVFAEPTTSPKSLIPSAALYSLPAGPLIFCSEPFFKRNPRRPSAKRALPTDSPESFTPRTNRLDPGSEPPAEQPYRRNGLVKDEQQRRPQKKEHKRKRIRTFGKFDHSERAIAIQYSIRAYCFAAAIARVQLGAALLLSRKRAMKRAGTKREPRCMPS